MLSISAMRHSDPVTHIYTLLFPRNSNTHIHTQTQTYNIPHPPLPKSTPTSNTQHSSQLQLQSQLITNFKTQMHIILQFIVSPILFFCILDPPLFRNTFPIPHPHPHPVPILDLFVYSMHYCIKKKLIILDINWVVPYIESFFLFFSHYYYYCLT